MTMFMTSDVFDLTLKLSADTTLLSRFFCSCFYLAHEEKKNLTSFLTSALSGTVCRNKLWTRGESKKMSKKLKISCEQATEKT